MPAVSIINQGDEEFEITSSISIKQCAELKESIVMLCSAQHFAAMNEILSEAKDDTSKGSLLRFF
jgi:hypothetical protein